MMSRKLEKLRPTGRDNGMRRIGRRHFLLGAGGFSLAIPFLESLAPREAEAGVFPYAANPRFVAMQSLHGAVWPENMFPAESTLTQNVNYGPNHDVYTGDLQLQVNSGTASLSPVLTDSSGRLTQSLADKMMVLRGIDVMFYLGHNDGATLGNIAAHNNNDDKNLVHRPTIDQVMAWSPSFYPDIANILVRSMHVGREGFSWGYSNPSSQSGGIIQTPTIDSSQALFSQIFVPPDDPNVVQRPVVVDRVLESYRRLKDGSWGDAARLSAADRRKLDDQMERFIELQRKLDAQVDCTNVQQPTDDADNHGNGSNYQNVDDQGIKYQLYNQVIASAFICGTSRVATIYPRNRWYTNFNGDWHQDAAHAANQTSGPAQQQMIDAHNNFFDKVFLDLCEQLDTDEANGQTFLDNSLVMWTQESGEQTHKPASLPLVCAGSAAGVFNTGKHYDYRSRNNLSLQRTGTPLQQNYRPGVSYNQWLGNVLEAMNVPANEYEQNGEGGYGDQYRGGIHSQVDPLQQHPDYILQNAGDRLPFLFS